MKFYSISQNRLKQVAVVCSLILFSHTLQAESKQQGVIEICTMSQNILKDKMLVGMDVTYSNSEEDLIETKKRLKEQLGNLKNKKLSKKLRKKMVSLQSSWVKLEKNIDKKITKDDALKLYTSFSSFDKQCQSLAKGLKSDKSKKNKLLAILNLQVQSLTALYIVKSWNVMDENLYSKKVSNLIKSYQSTYKSLTTLVDKENLAKLDKDFTALKFMTKSESGRYMPLLATKKASAIDDIITQILGGKQ